MDWYNSYKLVEDKDGYVLEIYLNKDLPEFAAEYMSGKAEKAEKLEDKAQQLVKDKFAGVKINAVKFILGAIVIATIPFGTAKAAAPAGISQPAGKTATVTATSLNVRTGPSTSYSIMHVLWQGNKVPVIDESGGFYKIRLSDGRTGWVSKTYLRVDLPGQQDEKQQKINKVVATAKSLVGTPYVYGGKSPADGGFDCSGFTQYVYKQVGYSLNRISADQAKQGISVALASLQPGDLVFFSFNQNNKVDHVGIYIGNGQMIHSPSTGSSVKAVNINVSYWQQRFVAARRIIY